MKNTVQSQKENAKIAVMQEKQSTLTYEQNVMN